MNIGKIIQHLRKRKGYSLREFGQRCSLSPSLISQVERGIVSPSIDSLVKIAEVLNCSISAFFEESTASEILIRADQRRKLMLPGHNTVFELATPMETDNSLRILIVNLEPGQYSSEQQLDHSDKEVCFVLEGTIQAELGDTKHSLNKGDSLTYQAKTPHNFYNPTSHQAVFMLVVAR